ELPTHLPPHPPLLTLLQFYYPSLIIHVSLPPLHQLYTLSLHDALPISAGLVKIIRDISPFLKAAIAITTARKVFPVPAGPIPKTDRKSTRLNSSHVSTMYAVYCLKNKTIITLLLLPFLRSY